MVSIWYVRCLWWFRTLFYYCWGSLESRDEHWAGLGLDRMSRDGLDRRVEMSIGLDLGWTRGILPPLPHRYASV